MPPRKVSGRGIVKSGNAGNSSKSSPLVSEGSKSNTNTDKEKPLFPPGSKYPLSLLTERCQKNGWEKPEVIVVSTGTHPEANADAETGLQNRHEKGYSFIIILRCHNKKTSKIDTVRFEPHPPFYMPTVLEARHWGATYALYRICNNMQQNRVLPPGPREYWAQLEQEHKAAPEHQKWMYNPDPFAAMKEVEERQLKNAKHREELSSHSSSQNVRGKGSLGGDLTGTVEIKMSSSLRELVEHAIKQSYSMSNLPGDRMKSISFDSYPNLRQSLANLSFTSKQIDRTLTALSLPSPLTQSLLDSLPNPFEAAISHLLLSTPECDLPPRFLAREGGDSFIQSMHIGSHILKNRWISEQLIKEAGFPSHIIKKLIQSKKSDSISFESLLIELAQPLVGRSLLVEDNQNFDFEERDLCRHTELAVLESLYPSVKILNSVTEANGTEASGTGITIIIPIPDTPIRFHLLLPASHPYPLTSALPPMYVSDDGSGVPPYIRLHLLSTVLNSCSIQERELGEGIALLAADILQERWNTLQTRGNPDIEDVLAPFLGILYGEQQVPDSTFGSAVPGDASITSKQGQGRRSKRTEDTRTNSQILQEINQARLEKNYLSLFKDRQQLPAWSAKDSFLALFRTNRVVVCVGETGSGKTTQIPQYILDDYIDSVRENRPGAIPLAQVQIMITQPRRVAAMSVASRVSTERGNDGSVSYSIRGESTATWRTKLHFCTTGVALRLLTAGDGLDRFDAIIVDEVHERTVDSDFLLLELRDLLKRNKRIKVVLMSATINHNVFLNYFKEAALAIIPGRTYPVQDSYLEDIIPHIPYKPSPRKPMQKQTEEELQVFRNTYKTYGLDDTSVQALENLTRSGRTDYQLIAATVSFILSNKNDGAVLIFLSGAQEIKQCIEAIKSFLGTSVEILPLHANLNSDEQRKVFKKSDKRKIIVSTNVAETSITIDEVVYVIDTGKVKEVSYDADSRLSQLVEKWVSKAAARQRRGRAGRTQPGECYKLYTRKQEESWDEYAMPEILRTPLESLLLSAKAMRETEDAKLFLNKAIDPPSMTTIKRAWAILQELGAIDQNDNLTAIGRLLALLPLDLRLGKMLILGVVFGCLEPVLTIAACLSSKPLFVSPMDQRDEATRARNKFMTMNSDLLTDVHAYDECMKVTGDSFMRSFCETNYISFATVKDITSLRADLLEALYSTGFTIDTSASSMVDSPGLLQSIIMAGLYPGIARVTLPLSSIKFDKVQGGAVQRAQEAREFKIFDLDAGTEVGERGQRIFLHPSSVLFGRDNWKEPFICYFRKAMTTKPYLRDATEVPLYAVLLFGGPLVVNQINGWLTVKRAQGDTRFSMKAWPRIGVLVNQLRHLMDERLSQALESGKLDAFQKGDPLLDAILALLTKGESSLI